ncbi:LOW QUALITY PROTEIN: hypothetical protein PHMEG_00040971 [Phytophthora megakarya]|uniref:HAT C-terminal dimerisation domain-containing protein n=1 Tax=Phytophthora megakarya TaxID=4795 RepID=A0A225UC17_9STRA|nr:LOW QUALITY PROTEIN: hypothetical protein PHMEG_00040971 [Phytophthora megakarya]
MVNMDWNCGLSLALIDQRIFTIPTSSASTERAWSVLGNVYLLRRNSLGNEKAHMLAAITINHGDKL